jgi:hypothetical protein
MESSSTKVWRSLIVFALLIAYLIAIKLLISARPELFRSATQAAVFAWPAIGIFTVAGLIGTLLAHHIALPGMWNADSSWRALVGWPVSMGCALGLISILFDAQTGWATIAAAKMNLPSIHITFPASAIIYPGGAIIVGIIYLLVPIPLVTWLVSSLLLGGRGRDTTLWVMSTLAALIEPITQDAPNAALSAPVNTLLFGIDYTLNLAQARTFVLAGFVPAVLLRVVFYGIWHVAWGCAQGV